MKQEKTRENKKCMDFSIDRHMIPSKLSLAALYCSQGYLPYFNVFLKTVGMTSTEAGIIVGLRSVPALFASPLWGFLTDLTGRRKLIITILWLGTILLIFPMPSIVFLSDPITSNRTVLNRAQETIYLSNAKVFYVTLVVCLLSACFEQPLVGFIDSAVMDVVTTRDGVTYGNQRIVAGVATVGINLISGYAAEQVISPIFPKTSGVFLVFLPCILLLLPSTLVLLDQTNNKVADQKKQSLFRKALKTCKSLEAFMFLASVFFMGTSQGLRYAYLSMYLNDEMKASKTFVGICYSFSATSSTIIFPFASFIIEKMGGTKVAIQIAIFSCFLRFLAMTYINVLWLMLPVQVLYGINYAIYMTAAAEHTKMISSKEISTTMFGIVSSVYVCIGCLFGNVIGGIIYDKYGGRGLMFRSALVYLAWFLVSFTYERFKTKKYSLQKAFFKNFPTNKLQGELIMENNYTANSDIPNNYIANNHITTNTI
ncbi:uncharacterized protein LOC105846192 [Hydra vulgaris]|uniref:uncharacterized protein LOC105846192 n=1 Tax=Hydra vulgaris TaxID=6087 RepID=UPI0032EA80AE